MVQIAAPREGRGAASRCDVFRCDRSRPFFGERGAVQLPDMDVVRALKEDDVGVQNVDLARYLEFCVILLD